MTRQHWLGSDFQRTAAGDGIALCGACAREGRCRLGLSSETLTADGVVVTELVCGPENEGGPEVAHGGWTAGVFDEMLGHVPLLRGEMAVTGQLSVTYLKPVPVDRPLVGHAWLERREGSRRFVAGELLLARTGAVLARATAVMVARDAAHFDRHRRWLAEQDEQASPSGTGTGRCE